MILTLWRILSTSYEFHTTWDISLICSVHEFTSYPFNASDHLTLQINPTKFLSTTLHVNPLCLLTNGCFSDSFTSTSSTPSQYSKFISFSMFSSRLCWWRRHGFKWKALRISWARDEATGILKEDEKASHRSECLIYLMFRRQGDSRIQYLHYCYNDKKTNKKKKNFPRVSMFARQHVPRCLTMFTWAVLTSARMVVHSDH